MGNSETRTSQYAVVRVFPDPNKKHEYIVPGVTKEEYLDWLKIFVLPNNPKAYDEMCEKIKGKKFPTY